MSDILKQYVCIVPFQYLEIHHMGVYGCCPEWLPTKLSDVKDLSTVWKSDTLKDVQNSILDGTYSHCSTKHCPVLNQLVYDGIINKEYFKTHNEFKNVNYKNPKLINYAFDRSCNLSCPSCRSEKIMASSKEIDEIEWTIKEIEDIYGETLHGLYLSGTADPFASKSFRNLLINFDKKKYPKVHNIQLHTNAILFNKEMWDSMKNVQPYIKTVEISIDAATKDTYEIVRRGGNWETLISNLQFISSLNLFDLRVSMVVQDTNYMEMFDFYKMMTDIFNNKVTVYFKKITNWGTYSDSDFSLKEIYNPKHPEFNLFLLQLDKINKKNNCIHNFNDIANEYIPTKIKFI